MQPGGSEQLGRMGNAGPPIKSRERQNVKMAAWKRFPTPLRLGY